jgi:hypothetical protein
VLGRTSEEEIQVVGSQIDSITGIHNALGLFTPFILKKVEALGSQRI